MSSNATARLAIDLGAGSGRAFVGRVSASTLLLREAHRFHYPPRRAARHLRWDFNALMDGLYAGVRSAGPVAESLGIRLESVGVDSWGVDYGLLDDSGSLVEDPICYRDERTRGAIDEVTSRVSRQEIFERTGIQILPLNTLYQLAAHVRDGLPAHATKLLMIPDLCHHRLCGAAVTERTNASTTQLLGVEDGCWETSLFGRLGLPLALMPDVVPAGTELGTLLPRLQQTLAVDPLRVIAPATHDTASAVVGTPMEPGWAFISSGTWSLVGTERPAPLLSPGAAAANFTNEAGACGTTRFLKNVMGLWILDRCRHEWEEAGHATVHSALLDRVDAIAGCQGLVFPDHPRFFNPSSMTAELRAALAESGQTPHEDPALLAKVVLDSLALRYASVVTAIESITGDPVNGIHIVGGGSLNWYLNQATADASGRCVLAGPAEATAAGNMLIQSLAAGELSSLAEARHVLRRSVRPRRFTPRASGTWADAAKRYEELVTP